MSHSPIEAGPGAVMDPYLSGWSAVLRLARGGTSWSGHERNVCFRNLGGAPLAWSDVAGALGADYDDDGRAAARLDLDGDGDEDLVVTNRSSPRVRLLANRVADGARQLALDVVGSTSNRDGIGARVAVTPSASASADAKPTGPTQWKERRAGEGYLAQSSGVLRFGLGRGDGAARAARVQVYWPGRTDAEDFGTVALDRRYRLVEGRGRAVETPAANVARLLPGALATEATPTGSARIVLATPRAIPSLAAESPAADGGVRSGRLFGATPEGPRGTGRATLVLTWASFCPPCVAELAAFEGARDTLRAAGLEVLALGADRVEDRPIAATVLAQVGWTGPRLWATEEALEVLDAVLEEVRLRPTRMPLPTAFLFDPTGALAVVYVGGVTPEVARADAALAYAPTAGRADIATPYHGRWRKRPDADADARALAPETLLGRLAARGLEGPRRELELARAATAVRDSDAVALRIADARLKDGTPEALEQALVLFEDLLQRSPTSVEVLAGRATALTALGRHTDAVEAWRALVAVIPERPEAHFSLGVALLAADDLQGAADVAATLDGFGTPEARELAARVRAWLAPGALPGRK